MDRDPLNECDGRDETNDQDDLSEDTETFLRLLLHTVNTGWGSPHKKTLHLSSNLV